MSQTDLSACGERQLHSYHRCIALTLKQIVSGNDLRLYQQRPVHTESFFASMVHTKSTADAAEASAAKVNGTKSTDLSPPYSLRFLAQPSCISSTLRHGAVRCLDFVNEIRSDRPKHADDSEVIDRGVRARESLHLRRTQVLQNIIRRKGKKAR